MNEIHALITTGLINLLIILLIILVGGLALKVSRRFEERGLI